MEDIINQIGIITIISIGLLSVSLVMGLITREFLLIMKYFYELGIKLREKFNKK